MPPAASRIRPGTRGAQLGWGVAWPANRRSCTTAPPPPDGQPWSERKKWVWWDGPAQWTGLDVPDFAADQGAGRAGRARTAIGLDGQSGTDPFIMKADGKGWLFAPTGLVDGPLPTHYEPVEAPVKNPLYEQQTSPVLKYWERDGNTLRAVGDPTFPHVITTFRLTEHHLSGVMSRWNPWLAELQPELFIEISARAGRREGHREPGLGAQSPRRAAQSAPRRWSPAGCGPSRSTASPSTTSGCPGTGATRASATGDVVTT